MGHPDTRSLERLAASEADEAFLFEVFAATRAPEFAMLGLPAAQLQALLRQQYVMRGHGYRASYPHLRSWLLRSGPDLVGTAITAESEARLVLVDVAFLPAFRGQGLGTAFLQQLQAGGKAIALQVMQGNPAANLYRRLGFEVTADTPPYLAMTWSPG